jgi:hypothetical protein
MRGGIEKYEQYLNEKQFCPIAMQVLASGSFTPQRSH